MSLAGQLMCGAGPLEIQCSSKGPGSWPYPRSLLYLRSQAAGGGDEALFSHKGCSKGPTGQCHRQFWLHSSVVNGSLTCRLQSASFSRTGITPLILIKAIQTYIIPFLDPRGGWNKGGRREKTVLQEWDCTMVSVILCFFYFDRDHLLIALNTLLE